MPYSPPAYNVVNFNFTVSGYGPPSYNAVNFLFGGSGPGGNPSIQQELVGTQPRQKARYAIENFVGGLNLAQIVPPNPKIVPETPITYKVTVRRYAAENFGPGNTSINLLSGLTYMATAKFLGYSVLAPPIASVNIAKYLGYAVVGPPVTSANVAKFVAYAILAQLPFFNSDSYTPSWNSRAKKRPQATEFVFSQRYTSPTSVDEPIINILW